jgi:hypothetical protein
MNVAGMAGMGYSIERGDPSTSLESPDTPISCSAWL